MIVTQGYGNGMPVTQGYGGIDGVAEAVVVSRLLKALGRVTEFAATDRLIAFQATGRQVLFEVPGRLVELKASGRRTEFEAVSRLTVFEALGRRVSFKIKDKQMSYRWSTWKQPAEKITIAVDFEDNLASGETISSVEVLGDSTILSGSASFSGYIVSQKVAGGKSGRKYKLTYRATTSAPHIFEADVILEIIEK